MSVVDSSMVAQDALEKFIQFKLTSLQSNYGTSMNELKNKFLQVNKSKERYVILSSSSATNEVELIMKLQKHCFSNNNDYFVLKHLAQHWSVTSVLGGESKTISTSGKGRACGCYSILQVVFSPGYQFDQTKISFRVALKNVMKTVNQQLPQEPTKRSEAINNINEKDARAFAFFASLGSNAKIRDTGYELSSEDLLAAFRGLGIPCFERSELHDALEGFSERDAAHKGENIRLIFAKKRTEERYAEHQSEFSQFMYKELKFDDAQIGRVLTYFDEEADKKNTEAQKAKAIDEKGVEGSAMQAVVAKPLANVEVICTLRVAPECVRLTINPKKLDKSETLRQFYRRCLEHKVLSRAGATGLDTSQMTLRITSVDDPSIDLSGKTMFDVLTKVPDGAREASIIVEYQEHGQTIGINRLPKREPQNVTLKDDQAAALTEVISGKESVHNTIELLREEISKQVLETMQKKREEEREQEAKIREEISKQVLETMQKKREEECEQEEAKRKEERDLKEARKKEERDLKEVRKKEKCKERIQKRQAAVIELQNFLLKWVETLP